MNRRRESSKARRQESPDQTLDRLIEMERRMMVVGPEEMVASVLERIQAHWKCSPPEWVLRRSGSSFAG